MTSNKRKLTLEQYNEIMAESKGQGYIPQGLISKYFSPIIIMGYGLYGTKVYEQNGEYWLDYTTGDSCD